MTTLVLTKAEINAQSDRNRPQFLDEFREMNPHLVPKKKSRNRCKELWDLLTPQHRYDIGCCDRPSPLGWRGGGCYIDHLEPWTHTPTGLSVLVTHPYCPRQYPGADDARCIFPQDHDNTARFLMDRGLWCKASDGSWYSDKTALVVIARYDLLDEIGLPSDRQQEPWTLPLPARDLYECLPFPGVDRMDWEMRMVMRLAAEDLERSRMVQAAQWKEVEGNYQSAFDLHLETALGDRSGGFDDLAHQELGEARRILGEYPFLDTRHSGSYHLLSDEDWGYVLDVTQW